MLRAIREGSAFFRLQAMPSETYWTESWPEKICLWLSATFDPVTPFRSVLLAETHLAQQYHIAGIVAQAVVTGVKLEICNMGIVIGVGLVEELKGAI